MDRRGFLKSGTLAALTAAFQPTTADAREGTRVFTLENDYLRWHIQSSADGLRSTHFENRITGRTFPLHVENEFRLTFSSGQRIEIPWWEFRFSDRNPVAPERESGLAEGFHERATSHEGWRAVNNLAGGHDGRRYDGYGWFRCSVALPESAKGKDIVVVLGGYDEQDWNEYWVYWNGHPIGRRTSSGRWRTPGRFAIGPTDALYAAIRFGSPNLLAVRTRGYDLNLENVTQKALDRFVFRPILFDQFVSVGEPFLSLSQFKLRESHQASPEEVRFSLYDEIHHLRVDTHYKLDGSVRRKNLTIVNESTEEQLLLDVHMDAFGLDARRTEGGHGDPVFVDDEAFLAIEHPAGINQGLESGIRLWHSPGKKIPAGKTVTTETSVVGVTPRNQLLNRFHEYILSLSPRNKNKRISLYTCYGINNQWGPCAALTDVETLDCQRVIEGWQEKGVKIDYFTIDQGWPDNDGDLTQFAAECYPDGPRQIVDGVKKLNMKFGLWFSVSGGGWSDGSYLPIQASAIPEPGDSGDPPTSPPRWKYRNGYPINGGIGRTLCIASDPYFDVFKHAVNYHVEHNSLRLVKLDIGTYYCNSTAHQHLPGRYSTEAMFNRLIDIAKGTRDISPDVFVVWYWGVGRSPFWAKHGNAIFESGLFLEGSGTSWYPTLYYRDAVTLALDQSTVFASLIPPLLKDSLGVWLSQIRWANFMGKERWREALIMDLGRGNLMFPQIWGDPNLLNEDDLHFLSEIMRLARENEQVLLNTRHNIGDPWKNTPYGYSFFDGQHGFVFCNNAHFTSRKLTLPLNTEIGLSAPTGVPLTITSHFPERHELLAEDGSQYKSAETVEIWLRPFETLLLEIGRGSANALPPRPQLNAASAAEYGMSLMLEKAELSPRLDLIFADASRLEKDSMQKGVDVFACRLPRLPEGRSILAIQVELSKHGEEYRHSLVVAELIILRVILGDREIQLTPVPSPRQYGNTQHAGCSWIVYKVELPHSASEQPVEFAVHRYLPEGVDATTTAWILRHWWKDSTRPEVEGFFADEPS